MAKKKIELRTSGSSVESGDVNITYNNVRIAGLSESTSAVLETEDTVCKHDIEIEYTKPESNPTITIPIYTTVGAAESTLFGSKTGIKGEITEIDLSEDVNNTGDVSYVTYGYNGTPVSIGRDLDKYIPFTFANNKINIPFFDVSGFSVESNNANCIIITYLGEH